MLSSLALAAVAAFAGPSAFLPVASASTPVVRGDDLPDAAAAVSFETKDKQLISGSFYAPRKSKSASPAALLIHDSGQSRDELEEMATYLNKKGFAVLTIDLRGHGGSETDSLSFEKAGDKAKETMWGLSIRDVDAAAAYLLSQDGVHASNLTIFGVGAGASLAVRHAVDDDNVRAVVLIDPTPDAFGYNLSKGVSDLGGLPTLIAAPRDRREVAETIQTSAHADNGGIEFVEIERLKNDSESTLEDKRLKSATAGWLRDQVMPRK